MAWGSLGDIIFEIYRTPNRGFSKKTSYEYAEIKTFNKPKLQYLRNGLTEIEMEIRFYLPSGLDPEQEMEKIENHAKKREPLPLLIGESVLGKYVIIETEESFRATDNKGKIIDSRVRLRLKEYN
jgi:phage protein U